MQIVVPLFHQVTALDAIGPYEVLQRLPDATVVFVGDELGQVRTDNGFLGLAVDATFDDVPRPDVVVVPGGIGTRALLEDAPILTWLRAVHPTTLWTTSVCTGSLVLGAAGLLQGLTATTHWGAMDLLQRFGAQPVHDRVVEHAEQHVMTAAGVSSGIDMALRLAELLVDDVAAQAMQLMVEYDPHPPFDSGTFDKATPEVRERLSLYARTKR